MLRRAPSVPWQARGKPECVIGLQGNGAAGQGRPEEAHLFFYSFSFVLGGLCLEVTFTPLCGFKRVLNKNREENTANFRGF